MRIIFFGSPLFAVPSLMALLSEQEIEVAAVVTQPDKPAGRGRQLTSPPIKDVATMAGLPIKQPKGIRGEKFTAWCAGFKADLFAVVAYGKIFPKHLLEIPRLGCVNLHASLLPRYRGAAPVNWTLIAGEKITGVTTMLMDEGMDTGPILLREKQEILPTETAKELSQRLAVLGAPLLVRSITGLAAGKITPQPQDNTQASYAPLIIKEDGIIDWNLTATAIYNRWRGFTPWPGIFSLFRNQPMKLTFVRPAGEAQNPRQVGELFFMGDRLLVACGGGSVLEIVSAQLPGKKPVSGLDLRNGYDIKDGETLSL